MHNHTQCHTHTHTETCMHACMRTHTHTHARAHTHTNNVYTHNNIIPVYVTCTDHLIALLENDYFIKVRIYPIHYPGM